MRHTTVFLLALLIVGCENDPSTGPGDSPRYSYATDSVSFGDAVQPLKGVLFEPNISEPTSALIIIQGSGPTDMDGVSAGAPGFPANRVWAESIAVTGIAVLRYGKHYMTYPPTNSLSIDESTQVADIIKAADFLKARQGIDSSSVFVLGHSEGGSLAPVAASWQHGTFAGLICAAATAIPVDSLFVGQLQANGTADSLITQTQAVFAAVRNGTAQPGWNIWGAGPDYWREWIIYSEKADSILHDAGVPLLVLQGLADENYPGALLSDNIARWESIVAGSETFAMKTFPGATHSFLNSAGTGINTDFVDEVVAFIRDH